MTIFFRTIPSSWEVPWVLAHFPQRTDQTNRHHEHTKSIVYEQGEQKKLCVSKRIEVVERWVSSNQDESVATYAMGMTKLPTIKTANKAVYLPAQKMF